MRLRQLNRLERADDVVRTLVFEETFVETGPEIPMIALVIFIPIKPPDATHDDERTDSVIPEIAQEMKAEVRPAGRAFESNVVEDHKLRHGRIVRGVGVADHACTGMVTQRAHLPLRVDDTAIL